MLKIIFLFHRRSFNPKISPIFHFDRVVMVEKGGFRVLIQKRSPLFERSHHSKARLIHCQVSYSRYLRKTQGLPRSLKSITLFLCFHYFNFTITKPLCAVPPCLPGLQELWNMFKRQQDQILTNGDSSKDRSIKKHQKRLSSGAATRIPYPGLSEALRGASGTLLGTSLQLKNYQDSILGEIVPLLGNVQKIFHCVR